MLILAYKRATNPTLVSPFVSKGRENFPLSNLECLIGECSKWHFQRFEAHLHPQVPHLQWDYYLSKITSTLRNKIMSPQNTFVNHTTYPIVRYFSKHKNLRIVVAPCGSIIGNNIFVLVKSKSA